MGAEAGSDGGGGRCRKKNKEEKNLRTVSIYILNTREIQNTKYTHQLLRITTDGENNNDVEAKPGAIIKRAVYNRYLN